MTNEHQLLTEFYLWLISIGAIETPADRSEAERVASQFGFEKPLAGYPYQPCRACGKPFYLFDLERESMKCVKCFEQGVSTWVSCEVAYPPAGVLVRVWDGTNPVTLMYYDGDAVWIDPRANHVNESWAVKSFIKEWSYDRESLSVARPLPTRC